MNNEENNKGGELAEILEEGLEESGDMFGEIGRASCRERV